MRRHKSKQRRQLRRRDIYHQGKRLIYTLLPLFFIAAFAISAFAAEGPGEKLVEGVKKTATGWTKVPEEIIETAEESNLIEGVTVGTIKGAGEATVETTEGAVEAATFYIPEEEEEEK